MTSSTRVLLLHTGGAFWVDADGMAGARHGALLRWLQGSPRVELETLDVY